MQEQTLEIDDLTANVYRRICAELNAAAPGKDYVALATKMKYSIGKLKKLQKSKNPTDSLLTDWRNKSGNNVNKLIKMLRKISRNDLAALLQNAEMEFDEYSSDESQDQGWYHQLINQQLSILIMHRRLLVTI